MDDSNRWLSAFGLALLAIIVIAQVAFIAVLIRQVLSLDRQQREPDPMRSSPARFPSRIDMN